MRNAIIFIVCAAAIIFAAIYYNNHHLPGSTSPTSTSTPTSMNQAKLQTEDVKVGTGPAAKAGDMVTVHYTGTFADGKKFDSSVDRGQPFSFQLGAGNVIQGWDEGVAGMKVGGVRKLIIPPELGYGPADYGPIPGNSTLYFTIELLKIGS